MMWRRVLRWRPSRIGPRLFAFNLLVMFVPIAGVLYLDIYEKRLLEAQEREMVQQARVLAAVLGESSEINPAFVQRTFNRLERRTEARLRVFSSSGAMLADSGLVPAPSSADESDVEYSSSAGIRKRALYRLGAWVGTARERLASVARLLLVRERDAPVFERGSVETVMKHALSGRYGAGTFRTPGQRSLTLVSAVPVRYDGHIIGAIVVSQSTFRILQTLYQIRLRVFEIVLLSIAAAALLTALAATTIVRPLKQLRRRASALAERRSPLGGPGTFPETTRRDEIGALARSLDVLTRRLADHIERLESFAADVAHEFRNPLASIRTAAETISDSTDDAERERFLQLMRKDIDRLDRLVSGVREMARIDGQLEHEVLEPVAIRSLLEEIIARVRLGASTDPSITLQGPGQVFVTGGRERLEQAFENVLANAVSFAPPGTPVDVVIETRSNDVSVSIRDRGPGIPDAHLPRIFDRFFSYRPGEQRRDHVGLGLSIARQIVESYGGTIEARDRPGGGAIFDIALRRVVEPFDAERTRLIQHRARQ
jgi:two-component system, OmpR family, sensor histidine kinase ChvG